MKIACCFTHCSNSSISGILQSYFSSLSIKLLKCIFLFLFFSSFKSKVFGAVCSSSSSPVLKHISLLWTCKDLLAFSCSTKDVAYACFCGVPDPPALISEKWVFKEDILECRKRTNSVLLPTCKIFFAEWKNLCHDYKGNECLFRDVRFF